MMKITVVALRKGGVGKTTTAQHIGYALASFERRVLLLDLDPQASLTHLFGVDGAGGTLADLFDDLGNAEIKKLREIIVPTYQQNLDLAPSSDELAQADLRVSRNQAGAYAIYDLLKGQRLPYDHVIIDTAPGRSALLQAALVAADEIVIPVQLSPMGFHGFGAIDEMIVEARRSQSRMPEGVRLMIRAIVPTFYSQTQIISGEFLAALEEAEHLDYEGYRLPLAPPIPETTVFEKASAPMDFDGIRRARTIFEMPPNGDDTPTERGQDAYILLAEMIMGRSHA